jgi:hypothetical protein
VSQHNQTNEATSGVRCQATSNSQSNLTASGKRRGEFMFPLTDEDRAISKRWFSRPRTYHIVATREALDAQYMRRRMELRS